MFTLSKLNLKKYVFRSKRKGPNQAKDPFSNHLVASYSCDEGYATNGAETRACGVLGDWRGTAPTCRRE